MCVYYSIGYIIIGSQVKLYCPSFKDTSLYIYLDLPVISVHETNAVAVEGERISLNHTVDNAQKNDNFTLTKDGETISLTGGRFSVDLTSLTISNVNRTDRGNYTITVTTLAGSDYVSFYLDVYCELREK